jgi:hypothetical protein
VVWYSRSYFKINDHFSFRFTRLYGLQPKFVRMRELHSLMFYLTNSYAGDVNLDKAEALKSIKQAVGSSYTQDLENELETMDICTKELNWRTFIPPLPVHDVSIVEMLESA